MAETDFDWNIKRPGETDGSEGLPVPIEDPRFQKKIIAEDETPELSSKGGKFQVLLTQLRDIFNGLTGATYKFNWEIKRPGNSANTEGLPVPQPTDEQIAMYSEKKPTLIEKELAEPVPTNHDAQTYEPKEKPED